MNEMRNKPLIYFDHAATTRVLPEAARAAWDAMLEGYGNPSSVYPLGRQAAKKREQDRAAVARALGCRPEELYFTSCGTESNNWAIAGAARLGRHRGKHIITTAIEHAAVTEPIKDLERQGYAVTWLQPDERGQISAQAVQEALRPDTILLSMMLVNNELGTVLPVAEAAKAVRAAAPQAVIHCDAVQGFLKLPFTPRELGADLLSISGHKIGAPKGIGALYVRKGLHNWKPLLWGGGQESGLRSGTEATAQLAALAVAAELGQRSMAERVAHMQRLKSHALRLLAEQVPEVQQLGEGEAPHILCLTLPGARSEVLVRMLGDQGVCISAGSACHRGKASHVFQAMPVSKSRRDGAFRLSFGAENTEAEVEAFVALLRQTADRLLIAAPRRGK